SDRLTERVRTGAADLALIGASGTPPPGLGALPIVSERLVAAVPPGHPPAGAAKGIPPDIALQASAPGAVADLAIRGLGIAILSESMAASHGGRLNALVIDDIQTPAVLALIWTAKKSPALRGLLPHSRQAFTSPQPGRALPAGGRAARQ